jgi:hypothetical protein
MIEDSRLGFNVIAELPTDTERRHVQAELDRGGDGSARRCRDAAYRSAVLEALHHRPASAAEALRQMERRAL